MQTYKYLAPVIIGSALVLGGCNEEKTTTSVDTEAIVSSYVNYMDEDFYTAWQSKNFTKVMLNDTSVDVDGGDGVLVDGQVITIKTSGTYVLEGNLSDGNIIIDTEDTGVVRLVLNGANITSKTTAPIYVKQSDKTVISLEDGTENVLTDATQYVYEDNTDDPGAAIFSKDDLTINGPGALTVNANYKDGITGRDQLLVTGGNITIHATDDGIVGRDVFAMRDANITIEAAGDGVKASNDEDADKGNIVLESGTLTVTAEGDGIQAEKVVSVLDGTYSITSGGGSPEKIISQEMGGGMMQGGQRPEMPTGEDGEFDPTQIPQGGEGGTRPEMPTGEDGEFDPTQMPQNGEGGTRPEMPTDENGDIDPSQMAQSAGNQQQAQNEQNQTDSSLDGEQVSEQQTTTTEEEDVSGKGIKAGTNMQIMGGTIAIDALDDALHSNGDLTIQGGDITVSTGDDGVHADTDVLITGGAVNIEKSYEGIEGVNVTLSDGNVRVIAADDGININGGSSDLGMPGETQSTTTTTSDSLLLIEGGYLYVNADGDGLDSNSSIKMTAGTVVVYGPTNNGNAPLDYDGTFTIEGGTLIASGSSGMALGLSDSSTQAAIMMTFDETQQAATTVNIANGDGKSIFTIAPEKQFQSIVISTPDLKQGETYTLSSDGTVTGDSQDGLYENATYTNGSQSVEFKQASVMTYINKDGIAEQQSSGMMDGPGGGGNMPARGERPTNDTNTNETNTN
ncbi:carbohydrate-binding domain-containing protein [Lysinibacillus contaminans]|nr:carbohydrate-binding domain-containing protein [Lysinibacillus contaminans]